MAVAAQKTISTLMRKTLDRQAAVAREKFKFNKNQVEQILLAYVRDQKTGPYNDLLKVLKEIPLNDENYQILFEDSLSCVVLLGRNFKPYVELVCNIEWAGRREDLVELFSRFVLSLLTAHTYHCECVMNCLIKLFKGLYNYQNYSNILLLSLSSFRTKFNRDILFSAEGENWGDSPPPEQVSKWSNIHTVIAQIVAIMPM